MTRRLAVAFVVLAAIGCTTATTVLATAPNAPAVFADTAPPVPGQFVALGVDGGGHNAFPTIAPLPDGRLRLMWRHGSQHVSPDGQLMTTVGNADGTGWATPEPVPVDVAGDARDPHLSMIDGDLWLTYFVSVNGVPQGARVARSTDNGATWEPSVEIDPGYPYAAISTPIIKVNGKLMTGFYGREPGATVDSAYAAWSTDQGATWTSARIALGASGNPFQEPYVVASGGTAVYIMRDGGWKSLASRTQDATGAWSPLQRNVLTAATGNSASVKASNGRIYTVYRDTTTRAAELASTGDNGITWTFERVLMHKPAGASSTVGMTYGHPLELGNGYILCPLGMERGNGDSRIYLGWL